VQQSELSDWRGRGGWLFPDDGFREVREIGYKVPLIYDFLAQYIENGGKPFDFVAQTNIGFPTDEAQSVFCTYAGLSVHYGQTGSNHPVLEAPSLVYNSLALNDEDERKRWLSYFLSEDTENQDALKTMAAEYEKEGDIWPETSQYLNHVSSILTHLLVVVNRYDPELRLGEKYSNILFSLPALDYFVYPNSQLIRWGDGKRTGRAPYGSYEDAYLLGEMDGIKKITNEFSMLLNKAIKEGKYERRGIQSVLWYDSDFETEAATFVLPRTDNVSHAGIFLQRNLSSTNNPKDGLMCFVGGGHMVHGHAEGMNIELYGCGHVLGVDNGRGSYQRDIHENYSRLFAAHNTVIVNGNSMAESGWVNLGINTVQLIAMEPIAHKEAVSPFHSFTLTSFVDDKGDLAEAYQERTLALIRTSETTGFYVDVFRSKSQLPNEFHDYLYHNIGDKLDFQKSGLTLKPTPERYMANAGLPWVQNRTYRHPGWHFFDDVQSSDVFDGSVHARFTADKLGEKTIYMDMHIPGFEQREYTRVMAPPTFQAPENYENKPTPTLVIRRNGEAWKNPFVVVFEPFEGLGSNTVQSVENINQNGVFKGVKVLENSNGQIRYHHILTLEKGDSYVDPQTGIAFTGTFAVVTTNPEGKLLNMYMGDGEKLRFGNVSIVSKGISGSGFYEFKNGKHIFSTSNSEIELIEK
jgi:hypothetical protein